MYALIVALALLSCFLGFVLEITQSNILHVRNGQPPNAGAALFPNIPFVPLTYVLGAWGLNQLQPDLGPKAASAYALVSIGIRCWQVVRARAEFRSLMASPPESSPENVS